MNMDTNCVHTKKVGHYQNRRCSCGWRTFSFISRNYKFCPICGSELEEYDMRSER